MFASWTMPCLPMNRIVSCGRCVVRWRLRRVVAPKLLLSFAYSSLPMRDMLGVEQPDDRGQRPFPAKLAPLEVLLDPAPELRQRFAELEQASYFALSRLARKSGW